MGTIKTLMLNTGVTLCLLMAYHTVTVGPSLNLLGYELHKLEYEWRRSDKQMRQFYNTMSQNQNKINEDAFNRLKELKEAIGVAPSKTNASQEQ